MKKAFVILLTGIMMTAAVSCGGGGGSNNAASSAPAAEAPAAEAPAEEEQAEAEAAEEPEEVEMNVPEEPMTYEAYMAAELDSEVVIMGAIQAKQAYYPQDGEGSATLYLQDETGGAYFVYNLPCTEKEYEMMEKGKFMKVKGYKSMWPQVDGEVEVIDPTWQFEDGEFIAEAEDVTALLGTEELVDKMNKFVSFKGMTVEPIGEGGEAFLYNSEGTGQEGDDLYFKVSVNGAEYTFTVESYLCGPDTDVYKAVKELKVGDVVDLEGFLYWYEGPNPHITAVTVK